MNITNEHILSIYPKLRAFSTKLTKNNVLGMEVAHSAIIKALEKDISWNDLKHLEAWLINACRFHTIDTWRKKKELLLDNDDKQNQIISEGMFGDTDVQKIYDECIDKLEDKKREVFQLSYFKTKTTKDMADELDIPQNTILTWLASAKKQFVECVEK